MRLCIRRSATPATRGVTMRLHTFAGRYALAALLAVPVLGPGLVPPRLIAADPVPKVSSRRDNLVDVVERVKGAVVNIHSERTLNPSADDPFRTTTMQPQRVNGMGTGIVLDPRGYIVTNYHVVDDVQSLRVRLVDGTTCPARILATDKAADLAVIKIDPPSPLPLVPLGTAQDLYLAERVIAIGNAYGYEHTVTIGNVSAMKRDVTLNKEISYKSLIQTQTPINPGNSGGPLFNKLGEVVGVNVAIRAGAQNIAFAIPVDTMIARAAEMLSVRARKGLTHGLTLADHFERPGEDAPVHRWVTVSGVAVNSPAGKAGFKPGDTIETIGNAPIATSIDVERALLDRPTGTPTPIRIQRDGQPLELPLTLAVAGTQNPLDVVWERVGLRVQQVGASAVVQADRQLRGGLLLTDVAAGSPAARGGLQKGDLLIGLHLWESITVDNILFVLNHKDLKTFAPVKAFFIRDGKIRETLLTNLEG